MTYDPDNPPLRYNAKLGPWKERFLQRVAKHRARWLARQTVEYADLTDEQKRIVDSGDEIVGQFPEGLTKEQLSAWIRDRFAS